MSEAVKLEINNKTIKVIVPSSPSEVLDVLQKFSNTLSHTNTRVIGFESLAKSIETEAIIALCDGESCLVYPLSQRIPGAHMYVVNFLRLPHVIFVGSGIKSSLHLLEKDFGLRCKNSVELGPLAAPMVHFASGCNIHLTVNWCLPLSRAETGLIASTAYSYFDIGYKKLGHIDPSTMNSTLYFESTSQLM